MEAGVEGEAVEESDDDPDVGAEEGEEDAGLVTAEPELLGLLAVAEEGVEEGGGEQAQLVAQQLQEGGGHVRPVALVGLRVGMWRWGTSLLTENVYSLLKTRQGDTIWYNSVEMVNYRALTFSPLENELCEGSKLVVSQK